MTGWKNWAVGEVVTEPDFQTYVQNQVVQVYAGTASRGTTLGTAVEEGMVSYLEDTNAVEIYDGSAWVSIATGDITAVTAGTGLTGGGTSGSVTLNANYAAIGSAVLASPTITGTAVISAGTVTGNFIVGGDLRDVNWISSRILTTDGSSNAVTSTVTTSELAFLAGVSANIQTQLDNRVNRTNGTVGTATPGSAVVRNITLSTATPSGGADGDVWLQYTP
jgi:hypothetical protein